jgi:hypothetical protein
LTASGRNTCFSRRSMIVDLQTQDTDNHRLIDDLRRALDMEYARLLETAKRQWARNFAGKDPSDACVSVRVTSGDSQRSSLACAGILRKRRRSLLNGSGRPSLA